MFYTGRLRIMELKSEQLFLHKLHNMLFHTVNYHKVHSSIQRTNIDRIFSF